MSLQIVAGSSGSGKSRYVYQNLIEEAVRRPEHQFILIVPEQFSLQTQRELVHMHPSGGLLNIQVLTFNRLAHRVFEQIGGNDRPVLEDTGKSLVIQRVIAGQDLPYLGHILKKQGAIAEMKSLVSELMQYRVTPEMIGEWTEETTSRQLLTAKLQDVQRVFNGFQEFLRDKYLTAEEIPQILSDVIATSPLVVGSSVIFDEFTGFTPVQYEVVRKLLALCEQVSVVVTADPREDLLRPMGSHRLFHMSAEFVQKMTELAKDAAVEILPLHWVQAGVNSRFAHRPELGFLEQNLFRYTHKTYRKNKSKSSNEANSSSISSESAKEAYSTSISAENLKKIDSTSMTASASADVALLQENEHINTSSASAHEEHPSEQIFLTENENPEKELRTVAARIHQLVRENHYAYRDIAIITGDLATYGRIAEHLFHIEEIPYFIDQKHPVSENPVVEFIRSAVDMLNEQYSYESVFRFLRSGFTPFTEQEIDRMENYVLALGIRGRKQYSEKWVRHTKYEENVEDLDALRERFFSMIEPFDTEIKARGGDAERKTIALYQFLVANHVQEQVEARALSEREHGNEAKAAEYDQIYRILMDLFDKIVEILGKEKMSLSAYTEMLEAGLASCSIGLIPPGQDQVQIGDIERSRLKQIKVLFFVGLNDGVVPKNVGTKGILSEFDREFLKEHQITLSPDAREEMYQQRFYLYLNLTKPSDRLYLSFARTGANGEAKQPSYLVSTVLRLFPEKKLLALDVDEIEQSAEERQAALETADGRRSLVLRSLYNRQIQRPEPGFVELWKWMAADENGQEMQARYLRAIATHAATEGIGRDAAEAIYGKELVNSATRLEKFASCAFAHFLSYGLQLKEREEFEFTAADLGNIMHEALQRYSEKLKERDIDWHVMTDDVREHTADEALEEIVHGYGNTILHSSERNAHMILRIREILQRTVWALQEQVKQGDFSPMQFEESFAAAKDAVRFNLEGGNRMTLTGRIDRVDICEEDDTRYVKVIDYKTGKKDLDWTEIYHGTQLQLMMYLNAALDAQQRRHPDGKVEPAGVFYYHIDDPVVEQPRSDVSKDEGAVAEALLNKLRPNGVVRSENDILSLFDREIGPGVKSKVIPVKLKKDGTPDSNSVATDRQQFDRLTRFVTDKVQELGEDMMNGDTQIHPCQNGSDNACKYCPYKSICGFDERIPGYKKNVFKKLEMDDLFYLLYKRYQEDKEDAETQE